jgi:polar amino acid transport system substrate-binding protein
VFITEGLEAGAGIRQPVTEWVATTPGVRVVEPAFMLIRQAVGTTRSRDADTVAWLAAVVDELKASGFVAKALERSGQDPGLAAD